MATRAQRQLDLRRTLPVASSLLLLVISIALLLPRLRNWPLSPDFTMLWAGARLAVTDPHRAYDVAATTALQMNLRPPVGPLPFPYPPSSLPLLAPFGLLPFWPAFWLWTLLSLAAFWTAARQITSHFLVALIAPQMILALTLGQTTLWIGALLIGGVILLPDRPVLAGALFGVAAAIKPQFAIMIPVAVIAGKHWRAISGGFAGLGAMVLASLPFGLFLWPDWLRMLGEHPAIVSAYGLDILGASPMLALKVLGLPRALHALFVMLAIGMTWRAFQADDLKRRVLILLTATLIASPYSIRYELAMLTPSLVETLWSATARGLLIALPLYCLNVLTIVPAMVASAIVSLLAKREA